MIRHKLVLAALVALASACGAGFEPWRAFPPRSEESFDVVLPRLVRHDLPSGLTVLAMRNTDGGLVHLSVVVRAGYDHDPPGKEGLARIAALVLDAAARSPRNVVRFGLIGANPSCDLDRAGLTVGIDVMQSDAAEGVRTLADFLAEPIPVADFLESAREAALGDLARAPGSPDALASVAMARIFSPWKDRDSVLGLGTQASLAAIDAADVERWLARLRNTHDTALVVAGPHDVELARNWAIAAFARWPQQTFRASSGAAKVLPRDARIVFIPTTDVPQTLIVVGGLRPRPEDFDAPAFEAAYGRLWGRISHALRGELQISYGASLSLSGETDAYSVPIRVRSDKTRVALREIELALDEQPDTPPQAWLDVQRLAGSAQLMDSAQHAGAMAVHAREVFLQQLPLDSLQRTLKALRMLDTDAVAHAAQAHLDRSRIRIVVVGDPKLMRDQLGDDLEEWTPAMLLGGP